MHPDERNMEQLAIIVKYCQRLQSYVVDRGADYSAFEKDEQLQDLCSFCLVQAGEACGRLSDSFKLKYPEIDWAGIYGLRCYLVHGYESINLEILWESISEDVPVLLNFCLRLM